MAYEAGFRQQTTDKYFWDVAVFANQYTGLIGTSNNLTWQNVGNAQTQGIEYSANYSVTEKWRLTGSYTFLGEDYQVIFADPSSVVLAVRSDSGITGTLEMAPFNTTVDWQEEAFIAFERGWIKVELPALVAANTTSVIEPGAWLVSGLPDGSDDQLLALPLPLAPHAVEAWFPVQ